jgi:hypothetical protein
LLITGEFSSAQYEYEPSEDTESHESTEDDIDSDEEEH